MIALPNPFTDSEALVALTTSDEAAAPNISPQAPVRRSDLLGSDISNVSEIFLFAKMLCAEARVRPGTISQEALGVAEEIAAYEEVYRDPPPLFLRKVS